MNNLIDYIKKYGNISYKECKFNEIDALIYSLISYIDFNSIKNNFTLKDAYYLINNIHTKDKFINKCYELLKVLSEYTRYNNNIISNYKYIINDDTEFGALTIIVPKHFKIISYTGTTDDLVGWFEDFKISYTYPTLAQEYAKKYLDDNIMFNDTKVYIVGHSKGGNCGMYASMNTNIINKLKIKNIFNFDGPGFLNDTLESNKMKSISKKLINYYPEESIVGMILNTKGSNIIIKSNMDNIMQHDAFSWKITDNTFTKGVLSSSSINFNKKIDNIMNKYDNESKKLIVESFFNMLKNSGFKYKSEINILNINKLFNIVKETINLSDEEKDMYIDIFKILLLNNKD